MPVLEQRRNQALGIFQIALTDIAGLMTARLFVLASLEKSPSGICL